MNKKYKIKNISLIKDEIKNCIDCSACTRKCKMLDEYCNTPNELINKVIKGKDIECSIPYSCNLCGGCQEVCPKNINIGKIFMSMRKEIAASNSGKSPMTEHSSIHAHQRLGFSGIFSVGARGSDIKRVFLPGCSLCAYSPELVIKTYRYLKNKLPDTAIILQCCGKPTESLGETAEFNKRYKLLEKMIDNCGAIEVITACQSCYKLIKDKSPKYSVKSLWTVFKEIGIPEESVNVGKNSDLVFSIHDSCPTRFNSEIQDSIRYIIKELGYRSVESSISRENTNCCGMGGMIMPVNPELFKKISSDTAGYLENEQVITYCASCREAMVRAGKKSVHILDLIFKDCFYKKSQFPGINKSAPINWFNRYKTKILARKEM